MCFAIDHNTNALIARVGLIRQIRGCPVVSLVTGEG